MDKRELRIALKAKLDHRRELISQNFTLQGKLHSERERNKFLLNAIANPLVDMALEDCADQIMRAVVEDAIRASEVVVRQTIEDGDYEIGIDIQSLHIRQRLLRAEVTAAGGRCCGQGERETQRVASQETPIYFPELASCSEKGNERRLVGITKPNGLSRS